MLKYGLQSDLSLLFDCFKVIYEHYLNKGDFKKKAAK